jgi:16S rRNA (cytosine1402-N4)-methyltransferase
MNPGALLHDSPLTHRDAHGGVVVLFPGGHGKPQLRPFPYTTHLGEAQVGTLVGEQQHSAANDVHDFGGTPVTAEFEHRPVMLDEVLETFAELGPGLVVDATVGGGGHAEALLEQHDGRELLGIDRDPVAIAAAGERLARFGDRCRLVRARFDSVGDVLEADGRPLVGALFDLGVSSPQLDVGERGFSHRHDAPLDMRMDSGQILTAATVVNTYDVTRPIETTGQLADVVRSAVPAAARRTGRHPAMKTFQAIRIEVNNELDVIEPAITAVIDRLEPGGRLVVISYHSGEDRIVKHVLRQAADGACECPSGLPCICGAGPSVRLIRRKVRRPEAAEVEANPRAASARFRSAERLAIGER